jgi:tyrosinase
MGRNDFMPAFIDLYTADKILNLFNNAETTHDIDGNEPQSGPIFDNPYMDCEGHWIPSGKEAYDIGKTVANRILTARASVGGRFTSLNQILTLQGIGTDKIYDLLYTFGPEEYRPSALSLDDEDWRTFGNAIQTLVDDGWYAKFASIHSFMSEFLMHSTNESHDHDHSQNVGTMRFLPWHRAYLYVFEQKLKEVDSSVRLPFWDWINQREIPPQMEAIRGVMSQDRAPGWGISLPSAGQMEHVMDLGDYEDFSRQLEDIHGSVHVWVGGDMVDASVSPQDPLFFLHHANVDRYWHYWQQWHADEQPDLSGDDAIMTPWNGESDSRFNEEGDTLYYLDTEAVKHCAALGYSYPPLPIKVDTRIYG